MSAPRWRPAARSVRVALVVGSVLVALNVGPALMRGAFVPADWWRVAVNFLTPLLVSEYSLRRGRAHRSGSGGDGDGGSPDSRDEVSLASRKKH